MQVCKEKLSTLKSLIDQIVEPQVVEKPICDNLEKLENDLQLLNTKVEVNINMKEADKLIKEWSKEAKRQPGIMRQSDWRRPIKRR